MPKKRKPCKIEANEENRKITEKRYLKWYNKVGYGSGDIAGNVVYAFLSSFVMIYLTNTVGLNPGIVGTLIAVSKLLDGVTDIFFGSLIDKTHSKMGKARPWMLYGYIGCAITLVAIFAIPTNLGQFAQYAWFLIAYTLLNAVIAACSEYTWLTKHKRVDGTMYSCTSLGVKLGGGLGTAITGWLLAASHFDSALAIQPESCISMLKIMYLMIPFALDAIITFILSHLKVEEANEKLREAV